MKIKGLECITFNTYQIETEWSLAHKTTPFSLCLVIFYRTPSYHIKFYGGSHLMIILCRMFFPNNYQN
jgi:hypothetical protein